MEILKSGIIAFMVLCYTIVGCIGSLPQIYKTYKTKSVKDMCLTSWMLWSLSSVSYLLYALIVNPEFELVFTSLLDTGFNLIILGQIIYYSYKSKKSTLKGECITIIRGLGYDSSKMHKEI